MLRESDRLKNKRIQIEEQMKQVEDQTTELVAEKQKINDKVRHFDKCSDSLKRHVQKVARLPPTIGEWAWYMIYNNNTFFFLDLRIEKERIDAQNQETVKQILDLLKKKVVSYQNCSKFRDAEQKERDLFEIFMQTNAELCNSAQQIRADVEKAKVLLLVFNLIEIYFPKNNIFNRNWWTKSKKS